MKYKFNKVATLDKTREVTPKEQIILACLLDDAVADLEDSYGFVLDSFIGRVTFTVPGHVECQFKSLNTGKSMSLVLSVTNIYSATLEPKIQSFKWTIE